MKLLSMTAELILDAAGFKSGLKDAENTGKDAGNKFEKTFKRIGTAIKAAFSAIVIKKAASELWGLINDVATFGDTIDKQSQQLGISRKAYQEWDYVLRQNGASIDDMSVSMKTMNTLILSGSKESKEAFDKLGVSMSMLTQMPMENQFDYLVHAFQQMPASAEKSALAVQIFGRNGMTLMPLLNSTAESVYDLRREAEDLGLIMSDEDIDASVAFGDALDTLKATFRAVKYEVGAKFLPTFTTVFRKIIDIAKDVRKAYNEGGFGAAFKQIPESIKKAILGDNYTEGESTWKDVGSKVWDWVKSGFGGDGIITVDSIIEFAGARITKLAEFAADVVGAISDWLSKPDNVTSLVNTITSVITTVIDNLGTIVKKLVPVLTGLLSDSDFLKSLADMLVGVASTFIEVLTSPEVFDALVKFIAALWDAVKALLDKGIDQAIEDVRSGEGTEGEKIVAGTALALGHVTQTEADQYRHVYGLDDSVSNKEIKARIRAARQQAYNDNGGAGGLIADVFTEERIKRNAKAYSYGLEEAGKEAGKTIAAVFGKTNLYHLFTDTNLSPAAIDNGSGVKATVSADEWAAAMRKGKSSTEQAASANETQAQAAENAAGSIEGLAGAAENAAGELSSIQAPAAGFWNALWGGSDGSHASGLWTVPYDDYIARLHRGERVLSASQARHGGGSGSDVAATVTRSIKEAMGELMGSMKIVLNNKTVGKAVGDSVTNRVGTNISLAQRRTAFGHGG